MFSSMLPVYKKLLDAKLEMLVRFSVGLNVSCIVVSWISISTLLLSSGSRQPLLWTCSLQCKG